ncbi:MAG: hypothetical protein Q8L85_03680 [Alphaproteobacteria bacterium]|nr:hypothetical protein [Alphaproteobacteria bacterium]
MAIEEENNAAEAENHMIEAENPAVIEENHAIAFNHNIINNAADYLNNIRNITRFHYPQHFNTLESINIMLDNKVETLLRNRVFINHNNSFFKAFIDIVLEVNNIARNYIIASPALEFDLNNLIKRNNKFIDAMLRAPLSFGCIGNDHIMRSLISRIKGKVNAQRNPIQRNRVQRSHLILFPIN